MMISGNIINDNNRIIEFDRESGRLNIKVALRVLKHSSSIKSNMQNKRYIYKTKALSNLTLIQLRR